MKPYEGSDVYEPIVGKNGRDEILRVDTSSRNPYIPEHIKLEDINGDRLAIRLMGNRTTDIGDFGRSWDGRCLEECLCDDIPSEFQRISGKLKGLLRRSLYLMDPEDYSVVCDFVFMTYFQEHLEYLPRLIISGCTESGKTRFQKILANICYRGEVLGDGSYASAFRSADEFGSTIILDEFQDINPAVRSDLSTMFKVGFERGGRIKRCNANTNLTESFDVFVPMVISTQEYTGLREDLVNRSFVIKMSEAPRSYRLDKIVDKEALAAIRHELHHLALLCKVQVRFLDDRKEDGFRLPAFLRDSEHYLEGTRDEDGTFSYPLKSGIDNSRHKELRGRQFDIARSMYPMARLTGDVNPLFEKLGRMAASNRDKLRLTDYGMVMDAWIDTIRDRSPQDKQAFVEKSRYVPTKLIANTCLYNGIEAGDFLPTDTIKTQAVRRPLETMGFILGYGSGNMTYVQKTPGYDNLLATNIKKFASPCNSDYFEGLPGTIEGATSEATNPSKSDTPDIAIMQSPVSNPTEGAQTDAETAGERR